MSAYYCQGCDRQRDADVHGFNTDRDPDGLCDTCEDNANEAAHQRALTAFFGGDGPAGCYPGELQAAQAEARRLKR